jgi:exodeoxyribonuclease V alpha subunit
VGDKDQLSSVEAGYVLGELCHALDQRGYSKDTIQWIEHATGETLTDPPRLNTDRLAQQTVWLRHSIRFSGNSGIGRLAEAVNQEDPEGALALFTASPLLEDLGWIETREPDARLIDTLCFSSDGDLDHGLMAFLKAIENLNPNAKGPETAKQFDTVFEAYGSFQILCAVREGPFGVEAINRWVERRLEQKGYIPPFYQRVSGWYPGRPVMLTRNNYELGLMNGDVGITLPCSGPEAGSPRLRVVFRQAGAPERYREILPTRLTDLETVYAMTVHKSQGSEFGHVVLMLPDAERSPILTKELLYTGITRAKRRLTLVGEKQAGIRRMIERKTRRSGSLTEWFEGN